MEKGDRVQLNKQFTDMMGYPYSEMAKLRYFTVLELPDSYGTVKLRREDLPTHRSEHYHKSFLEPGII